MALGPLAYSGTPRLFRDPSPIPGHATLSQTACLSRGQTRDAVVFAKERMSEEEGLGEVNKAGRWALCFFTRGGREGH